MKVKELIEELQKCPQDYKIIVYDCYGSPLELGNKFAQVDVYDNEEEVWI